MTIALPAEAAPRERRFRIDLSRPVLIAFAAVLCILIVLPMSWLVFYSLRDQDGAFTLDNFHQLVTDPAFVGQVFSYRWLDGFSLESFRRFFAGLRRLFTDPSFAGPLFTTLVLATSSSLLCCLAAAPMGWLVARTDLPFAKTVRVLVTASFVTPPFLGAIAWELLAAPNSGLLNKFYRYLTGAEMDAHIFNIYSFGGLVFVISCYTFPYIFVLIANALDRIPGDLEDASSMLGARTWTTARRITIPLALPALLAGMLIAFLQAMTLFGSPAILALPAGFHTMTTKIWSLFQFPPKQELAAAASLPLLVLTVMLLRAQHMILGRKGYSVVGGKTGDPRLIRLGAWKWPAVVVVFGIMMLPIFLPYFALLNAAFSPIATTLMTPANVTLDTIWFAFGLSATKIALQNTFTLGVLTATLGTLMALVIGYIAVRRAMAGHQLLGFLATAPLAIPGIVLGVGLFLSYTRLPLLVSSLCSLAGVSCDAFASKFGLYGTLWILLLAYLTIELPAAYQQLSSAYRAVGADLEDASRILGATRLKALWHITAPLLRTSVIATWCFIFVATIRELSAAVILFTSDTKVVSVLIFDLKESGDFGAIAVLGIMMLILTFAVVFLVNRFPLLIFCIIVVIAAYILYQPLGIAMLFAALALGVKIHLGRSRSAWQAGPAFGNVPLRNS